MRESLDYLGYRYLIKNYVVIYITAVLVYKHIVVSIA